MVYSQNIQQKTHRLVDKQLVFELFRAREYSLFQVEGSTRVYQVHLWNDGTIECTCPYWTYKRRICSHILVCQVYANPRKPKPEADKPELTLDELERNVSRAPDLFDPDTWR
ncbi:MAG: SWIM zinc finger family protein [Candidatus Heimdallarchaeota archaeon]